MGNATVVAFRPRVQAAGLTLRDRLDIASWREPAQHCGYDRLTIHERLAGDPPDVDSYLSVYPRGEPWSRFGVARVAGQVIAWYCRTGADIGRFPSVAAALLTLLPDGVASRHAPAFTDNVVRLA